MEDCPTVVLPSDRADDVINRKSLWDFGEFCGWRLRARMLWWWIPLARKLKEREDFM